MIVFAQHMNEFCEAKRERVLEKTGGKRRYTPAKRRHPLKHCADRLRKRQLLAGGRFGLADFRFCSWQFPKRRTLMRRDRLEGPAKESLTMKIACVQGVREQRGQFGSEKVTTYRATPMTIQFERPVSGIAVSSFKCGTCGSAFTLSARSRKFNRWRKLVSLAAWFGSLVLCIYLMFLHATAEPPNEGLAFLGLASMGVCFSLFLAAMVFNCSFCPRKGLSLKIPSGHRMMFGNFIINPGGR